MMNNNQIGVTFMPSAENAADGPRQGGLQGDVGQALKILSLQLPRVTGPGAISPLVGGAGAQGVPGQAPGFNPHAAVFQALLHAMSQQGGGLQPNIIPGIGPGAPAPGQGFPPDTSGNPNPQEAPMGQAPNPGGMLGRLPFGTGYRPRSFGGGY